MKSEKGKRYIEKSKEIKYTKKANILTFEVQW
jgi:hypothetical protein